MTFEDTVVTAVLAHMNGDHGDDNLLIARAFGFPEAQASRMTGLDGAAGRWLVTDGQGEHELRVPWPGGEISERPQIRREVVVLYKTACERLGVEPREEQPAAPHGHGSPHGGHGAPAPEDESHFSRRLREATWADHSESEGSSFMEDIMRGKGTLDDYTALVAQHYFLYVVLEEVALQLREDPALAVLHPRALERVAALEDDLRALLGEAWLEKIAPVPATEDYVARIREIGAERWTAGIIAHHYTRYLGDLSGGQMIARRVTKQFGLAEGGAVFYDFAALGPIPDFKTAYRAALDAFGAGLSEDETQRMLDEVRAAYRFNTRVFIDLAREKGGLLAV